MKIIVKKLQGKEFSLEVQPTTHISEIKREIAKKLNISVEKQKLLVLGRTLADDQTVSSYPTIKDGTKLNLVVKKPEGLYEAAVAEFKSIYGLSDKDAANKANRLLRVVQEKFNKMSWDDLERFCYDCLLDEQGQGRTAPDNDLDCEENSCGL